MSTEVESSQNGRSTDAHSEPGPNRALELLAWAVLLVLTGLGAYYRFSHLELKPLHHDEGVNGWFILRILDEHIYKYNPKNYHGPLLYFLNTIAVIIGGRTVFALRFMPALFGTLVIPAVALLRRQLGWLGVLVAAGFIAVAPIEVYFSRTAIHEIYNFVFNMTLVGGVAAWGVSRRRSYLVLAGVSLACLFATKETTIITVAAVVPALALALLLGGDRPEGFSIGEGLAYFRKEYAALRARSLGLFGLAVVFFPLTFVYLFCRYLIEVFQIERRTVVATIVGFMIVWVLLFSSLFTYPRGLGAFFEAFFRWGDTGTEGKGHQKPWPYFFTHLLWPYYRPLLLWGGLGLVWSSLRRERLALFSAAWFVLAVAAYSIIPYKTPWCVLSFSGPLFIGLGLFIKQAARVVREGRGWRRPLAGLSIGAVLAVSIPFAVPLDGGLRKMLEYDRGRGTDLSVSISRLPKAVARLFIPLHDSWTINFEQYDVKGHPFIYVQNVREYLALINDLHGLVDTAQIDGDEKKPRILMVDAKNPMRWYLQKVGTQTWRSKVDDEVRKKCPNDVDIVVTSMENTKEVKKLVGKGFIQRRYHERPGRKIDVFIREALWKAYQETARRGQALPPSAAFQSRSFSDRQTSEMRDSWSRKGMN